MSENYYVIRHIHSPTSRELGALLSVNVKASSKSPIVMFMTTGESSSTTVAVYGRVPPLIVIPQGWQVLRVPVVMFEVTVKFEIGAEGKQEVSFPANGRRVRVLIENSLK
jgi:hypothetical protein